MQDHVWSDDLFLEGPYFHSFHWRRVEAFKLKFWGVLFRPLPGRIFQIFSKHQMTSQELKNDSAHVAAKLKGAMSDQDIEDIVQPTTCEEDGCDQIAALVTFVSRTLQKHTIEPRLP